MVSGSVHIERTISTVSRSMPMRSLAAGNSKPYPRYSFSYQPAPMPQSRRPPEITSTVEVILASRDGCRYELHPTI